MRRWLPELAAKRRLDLTVLLAALQVTSGRRLTHALGMIGPRWPSLVSARVLANATVGQSSSSRPDIRRRAHGSSQTGQVLRALGR